MPSPTATPATCASWTTATVWRSRSRRAARAPHAAAGGVRHPHAAERRAIGYSQADVLAGTAAISFNTSDLPRRRDRVRLRAPARDRAPRLRRDLVQHRAVSARQGQRPRVSRPGPGGSTTNWASGRAPRRAAHRAHRARAHEGNPRHRSSPATLRKLADWHLLFDLDPAHPRELPPLASFGERVAAQLARSPAADRAGALDEASDALMRLTGLRSLRGFTAGERLAWRRWSRSCWRCPRGALEHRGLRAVARVVQSRAAGARAISPRFRTHRGWCGHCSRCANRSDSLKRARGHQHRAHPTRLGWRDRRDATRSPHEATAKCGGGRPNDVDSPDSAALHPGYMLKARQVKRRYAGESRHQNRPVGRCLFKTLDSGFRRNDDGIAGPFVKSKCHSEQRPFGAGSVTRRPKQIGTGPRHDRGRRPLLQVHTVRCMWERPSGRDFWRVSKPSFRRKPESRP